MGFQYEIPDPRTLSIIPPSDTASWATAERLEEIARLLSELCTLIEQQGTPAP
jgi:hypothetical protein